MHLHNTGDDLGPLGVPAIGPRRASLNERGLEPALMLRSCNKVGVLGCKRHAACLQHTKCRCAVCHHF